MTSLVKPVFVLHVSVHHGIAEVSKHKHEDPSQGTGVVGNSWFDRALRSILHVLKHLVLTDAQIPILGTPLKLKT